MFSTIALPCFNPFHSYFYTAEGVKKVPSNIGELLTPAGLAFWLSDDRSPRISSDLLGSPRISSDLLGTKKGPGLSFCTYGFTTEDVQLLFETLQGKFGLNCSINQTKQGPRIYVTKDSMPKLRGLVREYMDSSMLYKLGE
jgi:hypothetical protein